MNKISSDILFTGAVRFAIRFKGIIFIPLISVSLGVAAFGAYSLILSIATLLELVFGLCLYAALVRYGQVQDDIADLYYSLTVLVFISCASITIIFILLAEPISTLALGTNDYVGAFSIGVILITTKALIRISKNYYRMNSNMKVYSTIDGLNTYGIILMVLVVLYILNGDLSDIFAAIVLVDCLTIGLIHIHIISIMGVTIPRFTNSIKYLRYSLPLAASELANKASGRVDRILVGFFLGAEAVGIYSIVYDLSIVLDIYNYPIRTTLFPEFSNLIEKDRIETCEMYMRYGIRYFLIISIPTIAGIYLIGMDMYQLITQTDPAISKTLLLVIPVGILLLGIDRLSTVILNAAEKTVTQSIIHWIGAISNIILNILLIPQLGIVGAGVATAITYALTSALVIREANLIVPIKIPWVTVIRCIFAANVMVLISEFVFPDFLPITIIGSVLTYFVILFLMNELSIEELMTYPSY